MQFEASPANNMLPERFYSTTNHPTSVNLGGTWVEVDELMMDKQIIVDPFTKSARCVPIGKIKKGDLVVTGESGIRIRPPERPREGVDVFGFMNSEMSSEKPAISIIRKVASELKSIKSSNGRIVVVAGPAVVHTGGAPFLERMIELGYIQALLSGIALAVHDIEYALYGTSLGVELDNRFSCL